MNAVFGKSFSIKLLIKFSRGNKHLKAVSSLQPFPPAEKVQAGLGFQDTAAGPGKWAGITSRGSCPVSGQKDPFACSQCVWSFGPSNSPYGKTNANCWNLETGVSPLTFQAFFLSLKCLACDIISYFFLFACSFSLQINSQPIYLHKKNLIKHVNHHRAVLRLLQLYRNHYYFSNCVEELMIWHLFHIISKNRDKRM